VIGSVFLVTMAAAWLLVIRVPTHALDVYRAPDSPSALTVAFPTTDLGTGDRILTVDGIPVTSPAGVKAFWQSRPAGDRLDLRVQRAGSSQVENLTVIVQPLVHDPAADLIFIITSLYALIALGVAVFVAMNRSDEPASILFLVSSTAAAFAIPPGFWATLGTPDWDLGVRAAYFLPDVGAVASLHMFLLFPSPHPLLHFLRRLGPKWFRRIHGGVILLYAVPIALGYVLAAGPVETMGSAVLIFGICTLATLVVMVRTYRHPSTALTRPQLRLILLAYAVGFLVVVGFSLILASVGEPNRVTRSAVYLAWILISVAIGFSVLRYGLFDVSRVVRETVTYALLTAILILGYFVLTFAIDQLLQFLTGNVASLNPTISVIAAAAVAVAAVPAHRRLQAVLDQVVYRSQEARKKFLQEAADFFSRAEPIDSLTEFLTVRARKWLDLSGAWLVLSDGLPVSESSSGAAESLFQRVARFEGPTVLSREDVLGADVLVPSATERVLGAWYDLGARILVPLRAAPIEDPVAGSRGALVGVWVLGAFHGGELPEREDLIVVERVGRQAAVLLDYLRLGHEQIHQALLEQDLERAHEIQQRLLPDPPSGWPEHLDIAARLLPALETSGDFYDFYNVAPFESGQAATESANSAPLVVAVGDVQGKGIAAALVMAVAVTTLRSSVAGGIDSTDRSVSPGQSLSLAGTSLHRRLGASDFVSCALAVVESATERQSVRLRLANAGQVPPVLWRQGKTIELVPEGESLPLGALVDPRYQELRVELQPGDVVVFTSDGLPEARGGGSSRSTADLSVSRSWTGTPGKGEFFGFERMRRAVAYWSERALDADNILAGIWNDLTAWIGAETANDDVTLVVLRVTAGACEGKAT
jgi:serine phosphatase RsbU (regulator of sigma subunit)